MISSHQMQIESSAAATAAHRSEETQPPAPAARQRRLRRSPQWSTLLLAFLAGCGGGNGGPSGAASGSADGAGAAELALSCVRDAALLAQRGDCRADEQCPCGAACVQGVCTAGCTSAADCAQGESCDNFGRCLAAGPATTPAGSAQLALRESLIDVAEAGSIRTLQLPFVGGPARPARVVGEPGVRVRCSTDGEFTSECTVTAPDDATQEQIELQLEDSVPVGEARAVRVFADPDRASVSVRRQAPAAAVGPAAPGSYAGFLRLVPASASVEETRALATLGAGSLPVSARVTSDGQGGFVAQLSGTSFFPDATFSLSPGADGMFAVSLARQHYASGELISARADRARFDGQGLEVLFDVSVDVPGQQEPTHLPGWRLSLHRVGELSEGAAQLLASAGEPSPSAASAQESPWTAALRQRARTQIEQVGDVLAEWRQSSLLGCFSTANDLAPASYQQLCEDYTLGQATYDFQNGQPPVPLTALCTQPHGAIPARAVPCAYQQYNGSRSRATGDVTILSGPVPGADECDAFASVTGCSIVEVSGEPLYDPSGGAAGTLGGFGTGLPYFQTTRYCAGLTRLPSGSAKGELSTPGLDCSEQTLCSSGAVSASPNEFATSLFSSTLGPSGDLTCQAGAPPDVFPLFQSTSLTGLQLVDACSAELDRQLPAANDALFAPNATCIDRGRFEVALDFALSASADPAASSLAQRLLSRWLELHGRMAREALEDLRLQDALGGDVGDAVQQAVRRSLAGWQHLLDPAQAQVLLAMPLSALRDPDPRPRIQPTASLRADRDDTNAVGLPVAMLVTLSAQLDAADSLLERAWYAGKPQTQNELVRDVLQHGEAALGLASELTRRAQSGGAIGWQRNWETALTDFGLSYRRLVERLGLIADGRNPIGIDDADLPLYFSGQLDDPNRRFSAISDYLIGDGASTATAWLPRSVAAAQSAFDAAQGEWSYRLDKQLASDRRIDDITRRYGELITGYCGAPINDPNFDVGSYNVLDQPLDTETCFIEPRCRQRAEDFQGRLSAAALGEQLCVASGIAESYGSGYSFGDPALDAVLRQAAPYLQPSVLARQGGSFPLRITELQQTVNDRSATILLGSNSPLQLLVPLGTTGNLQLQDPPGLDPQKLARVRAQCSDARARTESVRKGKVAASSCQLADDCALGQSCLSGVCQSDAINDQLDRVDCYYDGAIAEQALALRSAAKDVEIARAEADEFIDRYGIALKSCAIYQQTNADIQAATDELNGTLTRFAQAKVACDAVAHAAGAVKDTAAAADSPGVAVAGGAAALEAGALIASDVLAEQMDEAQRAHDALVAKRQAKGEELVCLNEARSELVGAKAAALRISKSMQDLARNVVNLRGQKSYTAALWQEGNMALARERELLARSSTQQFWLNDKVLAYQNKLRQARRVAYLAVRAVEYEYQASLALRQDVIAARRPLDLQTVLDELRAATGTRSVAGSRPSSLSTVVSLRSQLLQLRDRSQDPPGFQTLSESERFRLYVSSSRFADYDAQGAYQGQRVPFTLVPADGGQGAGIPLLAGSDCAERLWSVNASILGDGVVAPDAGTSSRIELWKSNTFYSQWCSAPGTGPRYQVESVRPEINLFQEPGVAGTPGNGRSFSQYTRARVQAYHNVPRASFEAGEYGQGSTSELATRGLWGEYVLFFPASTLKSSQPDGLDLSRIDDILLRLDYVSVARATGG
jgi:hypothetical protein